MARSKAWQADVSGCFPSNHWPERAVIGPTMQALDNSITVRIKRTTGQPGQGDELERQLNTPA